MMTYIFADVETTGVRPTDKVVDVAWMATDEQFNIIESCQSLINPGVPIPAGASGVHGIVDSMVAESPTLDQFMSKNGALLMGDDVVLVAHNVSFDQRFLRNHLAPNHRTCCTLRLSRKHLAHNEAVTDNKLTTLKYALDLESGTAHSALGDVTTLFSLFRKLCAITGLTATQLIEQSSGPIKVEKIGFGKHKGSRLTDIPSDYRAWLLRQDDLDNDLKHSLQALAT